MAFKYNEFRLQNCTKSCTCLNMYYTRCIIMIIPDKIYQTFSQTKIKLNYIGLEDEVLKQTVTLHKIV